MKRIIEIFLCILMITIALPAQGDEIKLIRSGNFDYIVTKGGTVCIENYEG